MKTAALLSITVLIGSCTAIKQINSEKIIAKKGCVQLDMTKSRPLMDVLFEGNTHSFLFDTGAPRSAVNDTTIVKDFYQKEIGSLGSVKGADQSKIKTKNFTAIIETPLFESDNKIFTLISMPKIKCSSSSNVKGIVGLDVFFNNEDLLLLNFTDGKICNINASEMRNHLATKAFHEVRSQCRLNSVFVYVTIDGKEHKMLLDTGYSGQMVVPSSSGLDLTNYNSMQLEGSVFATATTLTNGLEVYYEKIPIGFAAQKLSSKLIVSETIQRQIIGIQFIKGFDWIIDYHHNKVYVKRNHLKIDDTPNRKVSYYAQADEKLTIVVKERSQIKYKLGDEIVSVNGQKVTSENNCELQNLINQTADWDKLNLEVVSAK